MYWNAYEELASYANLNPARPPILWADVNEYAKVNGFDEQQRDTLMLVVAEMELVAIKYKQSKGKSRGAKASSAIAENTKRKQTPRG